ncbi:MAG: hypothetical protein SF052_22775 [Bacteroidia bacterium]|nr:hypothetical protein [Bacteroidia bacterium]
MKRFFFPFLVAFGGLVAGSCERPVNPVEEGTLSFSADTVLFDSIFTTLLTPSERLIVSNYTGRAVNVSRIWLEKGADSEFSMIVDGIENNDVADIVIANKDSIHLFINLKSQLKDDFSEEYLNFQVGDEIQQVLIRAFVIDAYFLRARIRQEENFLNIDGFFFSKDTTLTPDKPIIMDGPIYIPEGVTVTVLPGTEIFFTPYQFGITDSFGSPTFGLYSMLFVDGTLKAEGLPGMPIEFKGSRLDSLYQENPAQWRGIRFFKNSKDNILRHCRIKNALIGIEVDSISVNTNPKVTIQYTEIKNMGAHGIVGVGVDPSGSIASSVPAIFMENSIVNTCKLRTLALIGGGKYSFYNCTFANYSIIRFSRRTPQMLLTNWFTFDGVTANIYPAYYQFTNCVIWGSEEDEIVLDTLLGNPFSSLRFDYSLVRVSEDYEVAIVPHLFNSTKNLDPQFNDFLYRDYRPKEGSPLINTGLDTPPGSSGYADDYRGRSDSLRYAGFDIGAWEYYELD